MMTMPAAVMMAMPARAGEASVNWVCRLAVVLESRASIGCVGRSRYSGQASHAAPDATGRGMPNPKRGSRISDGLGTCPQYTEWPGSVWFGEIVSTVQACRVGKENIPPFNRVTYAWVVSSGSQLVCPRSRAKRRSRWFGRARPGGRASRKRSCATRRSGETESMRTTRRSSEAEKRSLAHDQKVGRDGEHANDQMVGRNGDAHDQEVGRGGN